MNYEKIHYNEPDLHFFEKIAIAIYILLEINIELFVHREFYAASVTLLIISYICIHGIKFKFNTYLLWILLWAGMTAVSIIYSIWRAYTIMALLIILSRGLAIYFIILMVKYKEQLISLLKIFIDVATINLLYIISKIDVTLLGVKRIGAGTIESDITWGANYVGSVLALAAAAVVLLILTNHFKGKRKIIAYVQLVLFVSITLLCGSRIALFLMLSIPILTLIYMFQKENILYRIAIVAIIIISMYILIMNIPQLYDVLGVRVERLVLSFQGKDVVDGSINSRHKLIEFGIKWFKEKPLLGHGMYTFMALSGNYFAYSWYAHNNYIEILVGTGIIGIIFYYWYYLFILLKCFFRKLSNSKIIIPLMIVIIIGEWGTVSFKSFAFQFLLGIVTILVNLSKKNNQVHNIFVSDTNSIQ